MKKRFGIIFLITIFLTLILLKYKFQSWTMIAFIDAITIASLVLIIIGSFLFVIEGGFFSSITYSFRRFYKRTSKKWQMLNETEEDGEYYVEKQSFSITVPLLLIGFLTFGLALCLSFFI